MRGPSATKRTRLEWLPLPVLCLHRGLIFSYIIKTALSKKQGIYVLSKMCLHLSFDDLHTLVVVGPFKKKLESMINWGRWVSSDPESSTPISRRKNIRLSFCQFPGAIPKLEKTLHIGEETLHSFPSSAHHQHHQNLINCSANLQAPHFWSSY